MLFTIPDEFYVDVDVVFDVVLELEGAVVFARFVVLDGMDCVV